MIDSSMSAEIMTATIKGVRRALMLDFERRMKDAGARHTAAADQQAKDVAWIEIQLLDDLRDFWGEALMTPRLVITTPGQAE